MIEGKVKDFFDKEFGTITILQNEETVWFVGVDIARALGYKDASATLRDNVFEDYKLHGEITHAGQKRKVVLINEAGVYQLIFRSKLKSAIMFQKWVFEDVLPSIRKSGIYIDKDHDKIRSFGINVRLVECKAIQYLIYYARDNYGMDISEDEAYCILSVYANKIAEIPVGKEEREKAESIKLAVCSYVEGIITAIIYHMIKNKEHPRTILDKTIQIVGEILYKIREMSSERKKKEKEKKAKAKELAASKIKKLRKARKKSSFEIFNSF